MDISNKLKGMVGKTFAYNENLIKITGHVFEDPDIVLKTSVGPIRISFTDAPQRLLEFKELEAVVPATVEGGNRGSSLPQISTLDGNTMTALRDTLLENIKKIKDDKTFIPQAEAINSTVNQVIGLARTEIEYRKMLLKAD